MVCSDIGLTTPEQRRTDRRRGRLPLIIILAVLLALAVPYVVIDDEPDDVSTPRAAERVGKLTLIDPAGVGTHLPLMARLAVTRLVGEYLMRVVGTRQLMPSRRNVLFTVSERLRHLVRATAFLPVEDAGHFPHFEQPDVVNRALAEFFVDRGSAPLVTRR